MNCDQATELLPWLLNGTLDAGERQEVLGHLAGCARCRAALADTRTAWGIFDWHPAAAELVAYAQDEAAAAGAGARFAGIEEHLAACPACAAELELVRASRLLSAPAADQRIALLPRRGADPGAARAWRRSALAAGVVGLLAVSGWVESSRHARSLEERLAAGTGAGAGSAASSSRTAPAAPPAGRLATAAAARPGTGPGTGPVPAPADSELRRRAEQAQTRLDALARENQRLQQKVADLGRGAAELERRTAGLAAPAAAPAPRIEGDASIEELLPAGQTERGATATAPPVVPLSSGAATLLLRTRHAGGFSDYEIEIRDAQDRRVGGPTRVPRLPAKGDSFEEFGITLRRGALPPGTYTLRLFGRPGPPATSTTPAAPGAPETPASPPPAQRTREPLETYSLRVS
jgi:Putative zinc-finger